MVEAYNRAIYAHLELDAFEDALRREFQMIEGLASAPAPVKIGDFWDRQCEITLPAEEHRGLLTTKEETRLQQLAQEFSALKDPIEPKVKQQLAECSQLYKQYTSLRAKLHEVEDALKTDSLEKIADQMIIMTPVTNPILVVKQYEEKENTWHAVPTLSHVTDRDSLSGWLLIQPTHPIMRDSFLQPQAYEGKKTRYVWHNLSKENCLAQELIEGADRLRSLSTQLQENLEVAIRKPMSLGETRGGLFEAPQVTPESNIALDEKPSQQLETVIKI